MSQHDYVIDNAGGAAVRADINNALAAIKTLNSGATAPTVTAPFMFWFDTSSVQLKQRNSTDTAWNTVTIPSTFGATLMGAASAAAARSSLAIGSDWFKANISAALTAAGTFTGYLSATGSGFNTTTGVYTVPTTGKYMFTARWQLTAGATAGQLVDYSLVSTGTVDNGGFQRIVVPSASLSGVNLYATSTWFLDLNATDTVYARNTPNASGLTCSCQEFNGVRIN